MSLLNLRSDQRVTPSAAAGVAVTASTVAWTPSAWFEIEASTPEAWVLMGISIDYLALNNANFIVEVGVGGSGSEVSIAAMTGMSGHPSFAEYSTEMHCPIPVDLIPSGSRVSVRISKSGTEAKSPLIKLMYLPKPITGDIFATTKPLKCARLSVTGSGSAWTNGPFATVIASAADAVAVAGFSLRSRSGFHATAGEVDFASGAAASEVVKHTEGFRTDNDFFGNSYNQWPIRPVRNIITVGQRLSMRVRLSSGASNTTDMFVLYYEGLESEVIEAVGTSQPGLVVPANSAGVSVASTATEPLTWVEIIANTATEIAITSSLSAFPLPCTLIVGTGAAASEVELARWVVHSYWQQGLPYSIRIPAGVRVAVAILSPALSQSADIRLNYTPSPDHQQLATAVYTTGSIAVPTTNSMAWANGSEETLSDGTAESEAWAITAFVLTAGADSESIEIDIIVGGSQVFTFAFTMESSTGSGAGFAMYLPVPIRVPANTAVTARARKSVTTGAALTFFYTRYDGETVVAVPTEVEFADGGETDIGLTWIEVTDKLDTLRVHSKVALSDPDGYYGGYKDDRVVQWGRVTRALSDRLGQYEAAQFTWLQADTDRLYRGLLDGEVTRIIKNRPATLRMIDDASRRLQLIPRTMMKGIIRSYVPMSPLLMQFTMRDVLAAKFSAENDAEQVPKRRVERTDFPDCPTTAINEPVPFWYGEMAAANSATAPPVITGTAAAGAYINGTWTAGYGSLDSDADVPTGVSAGLASGGTLSADVPNGEYGVLVTAVDASGRETDPHVFYTDGSTGSDRGSFASGPLTDVVSPDGTQKITVSWSAATGAVSYKVYLGWYYYGFRPQQVISTASTSCEFTAGENWATPAKVDNITPGAALSDFSEFWRYAVAAELPDGDTALSAEVFGIARGQRRPILIEWLPVTGATGYKVYRKSEGFGTWTHVWTVPASQTSFEDDLQYTGATEIDGAPSPTGKVPVLPVGTRADSSGVSWFAFLVAGHACKEIVSVFFGGELVDSGNFGTTWAVPGKTGYDTYFPNTGTTQYLDVNGNRYTMLFVRGPDGEAAAAGTTPITVDLKGQEAAGDSTGDLITDGLDQYRHCWKNWLVGDYRSGAYLDAPMFEDDITLSQLDEASFDAAKLIAQQRIAGGYVGAWGTGANGELISIRDQIARLNLSFDVDSYFNRRTQFAVSMLDDSINGLTGAGRVSDETDIFRNSFTVTPVDAEHFNRIPYVASRDYVGVRENGWNIDSFVKDDTSIVDLDEEKKSPTIEMHCVRGAGQALDVAYRRLLRSKDEPIKVGWEQGMAGLSVEIGSIQLLKAFGGIGASGYVDRPIRITRHETDPNAYLVALEGFDMQRLFRGAFILGDETALPAGWTSATVAQQLYGYLADATTGLFSDGKIGKRLR